MRKIASAAVLVSLLSGGAAAAATHYSSMLFFGDSLTDDGNLFAATSAAGGQGQPPPPYFEGRSSNGPVWAEHVAADFAKKGLYSENYAYAFANAVTNGDDVPDLPAQIEAFKASGNAGLLGDRPVAAIWAGSNDVLTAMLAPAPLAGVPSAAVAAANAVAGGIEALAEAGIGDVMVFNMVPLEETPRFATFAPSPEVAALAKLGADTFNDTLEGLRAGFGGDTRITELDIHAAMTDLIANPGKYGVSDVRNPCFIPEAGPPCTDADERAFWDTVHPTTEIHAAIADVVRAEVAPIPLPAPLLLLLAGIAGMAAVGARRPA